MPKELKMLMGKRVTTVDGVVKEVKAYDGAREMYYINLVQSPHMLVAGTSGSGKSNMLNWIVLSQCGLNPSSDLRVYLGDPKFEFGLLGEFPHVKRIVNTIEDHIDMLDYLIALMEKRYAKKQIIERERFERYRCGEMIEVADDFPNVLVIIDEFGDLVLTKRMGAAIEERITKLIQKGRAAGITMVLATQNPIEKIVDTNIKSNCSTRVCFRVSADYNSRVVLGKNGGEKLVGNGHMLLKDPEGNIVELQGVLVTDAMKFKQIDAVVQKERRVATVNRMCEELSQNS